MTLYQMYRMNIIFFFSSRYSSMFRKCLKFMRNKSLKRGAEANASSWYIFSRFDRSRNKYPRIT